ncbi:hypothetical protein ETAA8_61010 [Anatilimnocola aggregata]|uniref:Uncharacterized protein n=1 Tax=Anatilimnocola aggregata TaxID=2528021 RepID=A0A517YL63_9BACT|nr:hypothetical protein ETAA8_61010 [Anatilimnocola aggregata]
MIPSAIQSDFMFPSLTSFRDWSRLAACTVASCLGKKVPVNLLRLLQHIEPAKPA